MPNNVNVEVTMIDPHTRTQIDTILEYIVKGKGRKLVNTSIYLTAFLVRKAMREESRSLVSDDYAIGGRPGGGQYEKTLQWILEFIQGKIYPFGKGMTSFSCGGIHEGLHYACLELEKRGLIKRQREGDDYIGWLPVEEEGEVGCEKK